MFKHHFLFLNIFCPLNNNFRGKVYLRGNICGQMIWGRKLLEFVCCMNYYYIQLGEKVFATTEEVQAAANRNKPKATSFKLIDKQTDEVVYEYQAPTPPVKAIATGDLELDKANENLFSEHKKIYVASLGLDHYEDFFPKSPESPQPHLMAVSEKYTHAIAAGIYDLRDNITSHVNSHKDSYDLNKELKAKVKINDGADGFGDFSLVSSKCDRMAPDHGVTYDFTIREIYLKPNKIQKMDSDLGPSKLVAASWFVDDPNNPLPIRSQKLKQVNYDEESSVSEYSQSSESGSNSVLLNQF